MTVKSSGPASRPPTRLGLRWAVERTNSWFDNARRLRELVDQLRQLAIEQARTDGDWPEP